MPEKWKPPLRELVLNYIKKHPHCRASDMYHLSANESQVRRAKVYLHRLGLIKFTKCECGSTEFMEVT